MKDLTSIASTLEDAASQLRAAAAAAPATPADSSLWKTVEDDEQKLDADLATFGDPAAGSTSSSLPAFDPVTAATPVVPAQGEPQPATATNVHASDGPLASEQAAATVPDVGPFGPTAVSTVRNLDGTVTTTYSDGTTSTGP